MTVQIGLDILIADDLEKQVQTDRFTEVLQPVLCIRPRLRALGLAPRERQRPTPPGYNAATPGNSAEVRGSQD